MTFETGKKYLWVDRVVTYVGKVDKDDAMLAVVQCEDMGLRYACFDELDEVKKKLRFWIVQAWFYDKSRETAFFLCESEDEARVEMEAFIRNPQTANARQFQVESLDELRPRGPF